MPIDRPEGWSGELAVAGAEAGEEAAEGGAAEP
jgi:hypothetical protein